MNLQEHSVVRDCKMPTHSISRDASSDPNRQGKGLFSRQCSTGVRILHSPTESESCRAKSALALVKWAAHTSIGGTAHV